MSKATQLKEARELLISLTNSDYINLSSIQNRSVEQVLNLSEDDLIELARRVISEKGAKYFGVPIGSFITPDMEDDAKAMHGGRKSPPGSVTGSNQKRAGDAAAKNPTKSANSEDTKTSPSVVSINKDFKTPTIQGPVPVLVGKEKFGAPEGSSVYKSPKHPGRVYVITPAGETHVITSNGELNLTPAERRSLTSQVRQKFEELVAGAEEETEEITWVRLMSIASMLEQAQKVGDESQVKKLLAEFRSAAAVYDPEVDSRELRTRVKKTLGRA